MGALTQFARALVAQRKAALLAVGLALAAVVLGVALGEWPSGVCAAVGIALGFTNTVLTEYSVARLVGSDESLSRRRFAISAMLRLGAVSLVALVLVAAFWPSGAYVLGGLAGFHMLSVALTGLPLLKELRKA